MSEPITSEASPPPPSTTTPSAPAPAPEPTTFAASPSISASASPSASPVASTSAADASDPARPLSKNQQRKLRRAAERAALKPLKRAAERERKKERKRKAIEENDTEVLERIRAKKRRPAKGERVDTGVKVVLDAGFDDLHTEKEIVSLSNQIASCYSTNRKTTHPTRLLLTSFGGQLKARMDQNAQSGYANWDARAIDIRTEPYEALWGEKEGEGENEPVPVLEKEKVVYLTADTEDVLDTLEEGHTYVVGAVCDHNRHKFLTVNKARAQGIRAAALPIGAYVQMASRKVLTVNQVYEILVRYLEKRDWKEAFYSVIPMRKLKEGQGQGQGQEGAEGEAEADVEDGTEVREEKEVGYGGEEAAGEGLEEKEEAEKAAKAVAE